ncbi:MAG: type II 3-dehydroquinate dehydratase [Dehalococcoidia bacterium]|nr:type II 3-dehydroquinate dehydratase [Dehalococcoidia bacterium]
MRILVIHGPNLNMLGKRDRKLYGSKTLDQINTALKARAGDLDVELVTFQSNGEGALVDFVQQEAGKSDGIIINPGALTHYGLSLRDVLADSALPVVEVHISNIYSREEWRHHSVIASVALGQISGLGWRGYIAALEILAATLREKTRK